MNSSRNLCLFLTLIVALGSINSCKNYEDADDPCLNVIQEDFQRVRWDRNNILLISILSPFIYSMTSYSKTSSAFIISLTSACMLKGVIDILEYSYKVPHIPGTMGQKLKFPEVLSMFWWGWVSRFTFFYSSFTLWLVCKPTVIDLWYFRKVAHNLNLLETQSTPLRGNWRVKK